MDDNFHRARLLGAYLGLSQFLQDMRDMKKCPDYLKVEERMIELFNESQKIFGEKK